MDSGWGGHFVNSAKLVASLFVRRFVFGWYSVEKRLAAIEEKIDRLERATRESCPVRKGVG